MDTASIIGLLQESIFALVVFAVFLIFAAKRGRQGITNLILGLYLAFLVSLKFPYYDTLLSSADSSSESAMRIIIFVVFTVLGTLFFGRLMRTDNPEPSFEDFWKKIACALLATILVMAYSYHVLPVTDIVDPGSPIQTLFAPEQNFFWWLLLPLIGLYIL